MRDGEKGRRRGGVGRWEGGGEGREKRRGGAVNALSSNFIFVRFPFSIGGDFFCIAVVLSLFFCFVFVFVVLLSSFIC